MQLKYLSPRTKAFVVHSLLGTFLIALLYHIWGLAGAFRPSAGFKPPGDSDRNQTAARIPELIWYKLGPKGLNNDSRVWTNSCISANPTHRAEFLTDESADEYVAATFTSRPKLVDTYLALTAPILKADLLRYLLLFDRGGVWLDLDVSCEGTPMREWIPERYRSETTLFVGWEFDAGWEGNYVRQFLTWTIMSTAGNPHVEMAIDDIVESFDAKAKANNVTVAGLTLDMVGDVVDMTGPRRFTGSVMKSLEQRLRRAVPIEEIKELREPKLVGDVLIMPGFALSSSMNSYGVEEEVAPPLVLHHYAGSWKNKHGGEQP